MKKSALEIYLISITTIETLLSLVLYLYVLPLNFRVNFGYILNSPVSYGKSYLVFALPCATLAVTILITFLKKNGILINNIIKFIISVISIIISLGSLFYIIQLFWMYL